MTISAILSSKGDDVAVIAGDATVSDAVALLAERRIGALPVLDDDGIAGIFSERDLIYCLASHGAEALDWPVSRLMSSPALTVDKKTTVLSAMATMTRQRIRHLPVVESGAILGIVSIGDLVKHRIERIEAEAEALRTYIQTA